MIAIVISKLRKCFATIILVAGLAVVVFGQTHVEDSLERAWKAPSLTDEERVRAGMDFAYSKNTNDPLRSIEVYQELLTFLDQSTSISDTTRAELEMGLRIGIGRDYKYVGDLNSAIDSYLIALRLAEEYQNFFSIKAALVNLGTMHQDIGMYDEAIQYYRKTITIAKKTNNTYGLAMALGNIGTAIGTLYPDSSIWYYKQSMAVMKRPDMDDQAGAMGWMMNNIGSWYRQQGMMDSAYYYFQESVRIRESINHQLGLIIVYRDLADYEMEMGRFKSALAYINKSLSISEESGISYALELSYDQRSKIYKELGNHKAALEDYQTFIALRDTLISDKNARELIQKTTEQEYEKRHMTDSLAYRNELMQREMQNELEQTELRQTRNVYLIVGVGVLLIAGGLLNRLNFVRKSKSIIEKERDRSNELLLNILPAEVAEELKEKGEAEAKLIEEVTVIFTDFKGFTAMSEQLSPQDLVSDLNECFSMFDQISSKHGIEKIKTIGDAYMAAGGIPTPNSTHAKDAVNAVLEMRDFIAEGKAKKIAADLPYFEIRIGVHTGPVVAGIVGLKKFQYDIWGDTVNIASRLENNSTPGKINISEATKDALDAENDFSFEHRGMIAAKGKGEIEMWYVERKG